MKSLSKALITATILLYTFNSTLAQVLKVKLTPAEFSEKSKASPSSPLIDVRSPQEFSSGHIANSVNYNWNGGEFDKQITSIDKNKAVFVYCLSGARSGAAAQHMRGLGFKTVYELDGGMMKWRAANMPVTTENNIAPKTGMTMEQFNKLVNSPKIVLIDFYADWCAPCKKMKPYLDEISIEMKDKVTVVRINADENPELCKKLGIDGLPVLQVYKANKLTWTYKGYIEKEKVVTHLK